MKKPTPEEAAAWQRIIQLCDEISQPLPPPPADLLTYRNFVSRSSTCLHLAWTGNCRCERRRMDSGPPSSRKETGIVLLVEARS